MDISDPVRYIGSTLQCIEHPIPQVDKGVKDLFGSEGEGTTQVRKKKLEKINNF